jgi:TonB-dependent SusC/RagA subfamily outer membrane receptor
MGYVVVESSISEASMPSSLQKSSGRALLSLTLLAGVSVGLLSGCARSTAENEAEPELTPLQAMIADSMQKAPTEDPALLARLAEADTAGVQKRHQEPIASLIRRSSPGVLVSTGPDGGLIVRIRGSGSFYGSEEPLYVIDGVSLPLGSGGHLAGINPEDIVSIKVLKDPPETALYGVRGANGVILITTRRP